MDQVENQGSEQEIASPETEAKQEAPAQVESIPEKDWIRNLRRGYEDLSKENKMLKELLPRMVPQQQASQQVEEDILSDIQKEEFVPGEKVAKGFRKLEEKFERKVQEIEKKYAQKQYYDSYSELRREYPDLEEIVNPETLAIVKQTNPRLAEAWSRLDDYSIAVQAYPYIKNAGILDKVNGGKRVKEVEKKIEQNKKTVQTPQVYEKRPMAQAFNLQSLSEEQKKELQREMNHYAGLAGGGY